ncbi:MAG TPA: hypothetical protein VFD94_03440, partial [Jatrophihabitans sp.]|nr:hypothetical protein [Jatrophihabitans sp.]
MNENRLLPGADRAAVSRQLTAAAAELAHTFADVVEQVGGAEQASLAAVAFLRDWADSAGPVLPALGLPLDLLTARYRLACAERDLLLLAGLAQEHEGLSSTLRSVHPQSAACPTVGLAALVLDRRGHDRVQLRRLLTEGPAIRAGLLRLDDGEALFERSILLADGLWEALHGLDAFPAGLDRVTCREVPGGLAGWLAEPAVRRAGQAVRDGLSVTVLVQSADEAVALGRCAALGGSVGARLLAARARPDDAVALRLLAAHAVVRDAVPVLVARQPADGARPAELAVPELPGPLLVIVPAGSALRFPADRPVLAVPAGELSALDRRLAWLAALPELSEPDAATLAGRHLLDPAW